MGLLDKIVGPVKALFAKPTQYANSYKMLTEYSASFANFDGDLYEQLQTRAIIERIATACSKLKPEFVTPDGSMGAVPRVQRLFTSFPNDMQTWPNLLRITSGRLFRDTVGYVVPGYDRDRNISSLWSLKPQYTEVVEYEGEPWLRFHLANGEIQAFPFYDVVILTRFQMDSDVFGSGNQPLTPTLRLMDAQRQAEEIALKTGADIRFIGRIGQVMHQNDVAEKRKQFADDNLNPNKNTYGLLLYDGTIQDLQQVKPQSYTVPTEEMERIDKALYAYFGINEKILNSSFDEATWSAFYETTIEPFAIQFAEKLSQVLLTPTQVRKGNRIMFSSSYLEYATTDAKIKVVKELGSMGALTFDAMCDVFQLPHMPGGKARPVRGEIYLLDEDNNIIAESGGHNSTTVESEVTDVSDIDEPDADETDDVTRAVNARMAQMIDRRVAEVGA